eukprot:18173-Eustigmatos_ZCMA.PRE.1
MQYGALRRSNYVSHQAALGAAKKCTSGQGRCAKHGRSKVEAGCAEHGRLIERLQEAVKCV